MLHMPAAAPCSLRAFRTAALASASVLSLMAAAPSAAQDATIAYGTTETVIRSWGTQPSPWNINGDLTVQGRLAITDGTVTNNNAKIDWHTNGGVVDVAGEFASWTTNLDLMVGDAFKGTLTVANGGTVSSLYGVIGEQSGSEGAVTVTGANSHWNVTEYALVGNDGFGTLRVENSGKVTAKTIYVAGTASTPLTVASGGILETGAVAAFYGTSTGLVTFDGGTLRLTKAQANLFSGLNVSVVGNGATIDTQIHNVTAIAPITGTGGLTKQGAGILTLTGTNTYTGTTTVAAGLLRAGSATAFSAGSTYNVASGAVLDLNGFASTIGGLSGSGTVLLSGALLTIDQNSNTTFGGTISGANGIAKRGTGTLTLTGSSTYSGGTVVAGGTLKAGSVSAFKQNGIYTVNSGTLDLGGYALTMNALTGTGGTVALGTAGLTVAQSTDTTFAGDITGTGTGTFTKQGTGTLTLSGSSSGFTGSTVVSGGTLRAASSSAFAQNGSYTVNGGTLDLNDYALTMSSLSGTGGAIELGSASLTVVQNIQNFYMGNITGSGSFIKQGTAQLTLDGTNSYTGGTVVEDGSLRAGSASAFVQNSGYTINGGVLDLSIYPLTMTSLSGTGGTVLLGGAGGNLTVAQNSDSTFAGSIAGPGGFAKQGTGTLTLSGANAYNGNTTVAGGTLKAGSATAFMQNGTYTVNDGTLDLGGHALTMRTLTGTGGTIAMGAANLTLAQTSDSTYHGAITGTGSLIRDGADILTLTGVNNYTGGTVVKDGTLQAGSATAFIQNGDYTVNNGTLDLNGHALTMGSLVGTGYHGTVALGAANLTVAQTIYSTYLGGITGTGSFTKQGPGTLILGGVNSYTGGTVVEDGTLVADFSAAFVQNSSYTVNGGRLALGSHDLTMSSLAGTGGVVELSGANLTVAQSADTTFAGNITGTGSLDKQGGGTLILTGDSSAFAGSTTVSGGTLVVGAGGAGLLGGAVTVGNGGRLGGSGTIGSHVSVASGGILGPGNSPGTLNISGDLTLAGGSLLAFELGQAGTVGGALNDHIVVGGNLVLDGTLDVSVAAGGTVGAGVYRLISYGGTLIDNGLTLGTTPAGSEVRLQTAVQGQVNLVNTAGLTLRYWDGTTGPNNGVIEGGSGVWRAGSSLNWTDAGGLINGGYTDASFAVFGGSGGTVTLDASQGAVRASGLQFMADGYVLTGDALTLTGPVSTLRVGDGTAAGAGMTATVHSALTGAAQLVKTDLGTLVLTGANSYTGGTLVAGGTLRAGSGNAFVQNVGYIVNGGTLDLGGHALTMRTLAGTGGTIALGAANLTVEQNVATTYAGSFTGSGSFTKLGLGTLTLSGNNSGFTGNTIIAGGTLKAGSATAFSAGSTYDIASGATLDLNGYNSAIGGLSGTGGTVALGAASLTLAQTADTTFAGSLTGTGGLTKQGGGTLTLSGANTYTGGTVVEGGTLRAGSSTAFRQNGSYILNGGTLDLNGHALTIAALSGSGGAIALGGAALTLALEADTTFAGNLTGAGALIKQGGGTLIFTGDNSGFAGTVRLAQGHMVVGRGGAATLGGTVELGAGGRLSGSGTVGSTVVGTNAILAPGNSIGTLTVSGDLTLGAGSLYEVEVDPTGSASDRVHITGKARLEGGTVLHLGEAGEYQPLARYTILTADGGVEGTFGAVRSQFAFLTPTLSYAANTVSLELARNTARFADAAATRNQRATAEAAERLGAGHAVYDALLLLPDDAARVRHAFEQLSGEVHASARSVLLEDSRFVREAVAQQLRGGSGGGLWTQTFGGWGRRSGDGNAARLTHNTQGILLGWDAALGAGSAGVVAGYGNADLSVSQRASSAEAETYHLGLYWGARLGNVSLRGGAAYSWHDVETRRDATVAALSQTLRADYKSASVQAFAEAAWAVTLGRATLEPFAGLAHVINTTDDFAETGGTAGLAGGGGALAVTFGTLGLNARLGFDLGRLPATVHTSFGWQHAFGETAPTARLGFSASDLFTVAGSPLARDAARLQTGLQLAVSERTSLGLGYSGQFAGGVEKHDLSARFSVRF